MPGATAYFCDRFFDRRDRTRDQMVQAARSAKQNITEAGQASGTSKETELKLTNVARASLEELLADYRDFLRTRHLTEWDRDHPRAQRLRQLNRQRDALKRAFLLSTASALSPGAKNAMRLLFQPPGGGGNALVRRLAKVKPSA